MGHISVIAAWRRQFCRYREILVKSVFPRVACPEALATLRSLGSRLLTTLPPIQSVPEVMASKVRHHPKSRRLARAGRPYEDHQLPLCDVQVQLGNRRQPVGVDIAHRFQIHSCDGVSLTTIKLTSADRSVEIGLALFCVKPRFYAPRARSSPRPMGYPDA